MKFDLKVMHGTQDLASRFCFGFSHDTKNHFISQIFFSKVSLEIYLEQ